MISSEYIYINININNILYIYLVQLLSWKSAAVGRLFRATA